mmetsp:Transcript_21698/g.37271  ORF Transcript_21698/g.37271 Transcript_21698/m.37271 type:complete len:214 (-) Transcript_21698:31-672(-)|eukprot:CAMPEP_0196652388 /NCGR_PEP_ID=MMETSP1086-20130531/1664_1 /TAXON_ID=77921 /ORGANISM="Cyanoptyche  gloeocystis , Strain SAG4.97" /LENGTH=213 /DNA_ID=CAMNT_0041982905 /DNA_START=225 /DNA_END=866 /DNA_ORIENTATION=+
MYLYYKYRPKGFWWELSKPYLDLVKVQLPGNIYGRKVSHMSHRADVLRLQLLLEKGGIYMDMDIITLKDFGPLLRHEFVMGQEGMNAEIGLCNAVLISRPNSVFVRRWLNAYRTFDEREWSYHSVVLPHEIAKDFPEEIEVVHHRAFFWPLWNEQGMHILFEEDDYDFASNYAVHLWEQASYERYLKNVTVDYIRNCSSNFCRAARRFLGPDL